MTVKKTNALFNNKATLKFSIIPNFEFNAKAYQLPSISLNILERPTATIPTRHAGTQLTFSQTFSIMFLVDEDMEAYMEIYNWMVGIGSPDDHDQYKEFMVKTKKDNMYSDATMYLNTSHFKPNLKVQFENCCPIGLSGLDFSVPTSSPSELTADATFAYTKYTLSKL